MAANRNVRRSVDKNESPIDFVQMDGLVSEFGRFVDPNHMLSWNFRLS